MINEGWATSPNVQAYTEIQFKEEKSKEDMSQRMERMWDKQTPTSIGKDHIKGKHWKNLEINQVILSKPRTGRILIFWATLFLSQFHYKFLCCESGLSEASIYFWINILGWRFMRPLNIIVDNKSQFPDTDTILMDR